MPDKTNMIKLTEVIGLTTALSVLLSLAYVMGMSMAVQIPLLPLMTIENVVMTSMQLLIIVVLIVGWHFTRAETAKAKAGEQDSYKPIERFNRTGRVFLILSGISAVLSFLSRSYPVGIMNSFIFIYMLIARKNSDRYYSYMEKFVPTQTAYLLMLLPVMVFFTTFSGYGYGKSGFSVLTWKTLAIEAKPNGNETGKYYGKLLCSLGEKYLILRYEGSELNPCVIDKSQVTTIYTAKFDDLIKHLVDSDEALKQTESNSVKKMHNQNMDPTVKTPVESGKVQGTAGQL